MSSSKIKVLHQQAIKGSESAERELFRLLSERFLLIAHHKIGWNQDAEDIAQDALLKVHRLYREVEIEHSFAAWAGRVLEFGILNFLAAKQRRSLREIDDTGQWEHASSEDVSAGIQVRDALQHCFRKLIAANRAYARVINLRLQGFSSQEVCAKLKVTRSSLYTSMHRARLLLTECLRKEGARE